MPARGHDPDRKRRDETRIRADSTWQRALELVVEETVPELRGRWAERRLVDSRA